MIILDNITLIVCGILIVFAAVTPFINPLFRFRSRAEEAVEDNMTDEELTQTDLPPVAVIISAHDNAKELKENLPLFLSQQYPTDFQIIVVVEKSTDGTEDVLKLFASDEHLYTTFIPTSSRYVSRKKVAVTIGVKASKYDWVILTDPQCRPASDKWLATMARNFKKGTDVVMGYSNYADDAKAFCKFETLQTACYLLPRAMKKAPYRTNATNLAFRKEMFMQGGGYQGNLELVRGEYDFIVNKFGTEDNTAVEISSDAWITENAPTRKAWRDEQLNFMEVRKFLANNFTCRTLFNLDNLLLHLNYIIIIAALIYSIITMRWVITAVAAVALIVTIVLRTHIAKRMFRIFDVDISAFKVAVLELNIFWNKFITQIIHGGADRRDFISHKI